MASEPVEPSKHRPIAIFDLDGTITRSDTFLRFLIGSLLRTPSRWLRSPALVAAVLMFTAKQRDNSWLKASFLRHIVGGRPRSKVEAHAKAYVDAVLKSHVLDPALAEISRLKREGAALVLASASPDIYVEALGRRLGFDEVLCTRVEAGDGCWTGRIDGANCYGAEKKRRVDSYLASIEADWSDVAFYSDHHSDLPLLTAAGRRFAVNPTPKLAKAAAGVGIPVLDWRAARSGPAT